MSNTDGLYHMYGLRKILLCQSLSVSVAVEEEPDNCRSNISLAVLCKWWQHGVTWTVYTRYTLVYLHSDRTTPHRPVNQTQPIRTTPHWPVNQTQPIRTTPHRPVNQTQPITQNDVRQLMQINCTDISLLAPIIGNASH